LKKYWNSFKTVVTDPSKKLASKKVLYTMGIGLVISYLYFTHESPRVQDKKMADVFKKGKIDREFNPTKLVKRENLENALKEILQLSFQKYFLISGEHGTGKTTLVQNTILNLQEPKHATSPHSELLYEKYKRPIVLILDQVDRIAKEDPKFLRILQDFAKDCADKGTLVIVFIASEGLVPQIMRSRSAWSQASTPFEVGDISDEEAVKFLQDSGIDKKKAEDAVKYLTGERFILLEEVQLLNRVNPKNLVEKFKEQMFTQIKRDLDTVELPANHEFFIKLIEVDHIDIRKAKTIIPLNMIHKLVEANILKEHQDYTVSFHSRYIDTYFKEVILADDVIH
ncbi:9854_t:CDS:2, partial [Ambispora leptoticha]